MRIPQPYPKSTGGATRTRRCGWLNARRGARDAPAKERRKAIPGGQASPTWLAATRRDRSSSAAAKAGARQASGSLAALVCGRRAGYARHMSTLADYSIVIALYATTAVLCGALLFYLTRPAPQRRKWLPSLSAAGVIATFLIATLALADERGEAELQARCVEKIGDEVTDDVKQQICRCATREVRARLRTWSAQDSSEIFARCLAELHQPTREL